MNPRLTHASPAPVFPGLATATAMALGLIASPVLAPEVRAHDVTSARRVLSRYGEAVVTVKVVLERRFISQGRERNASDSQMEVSGTILTPAGLTVVSDATTDPAALSRQSAHSRSRMETKTTDVKIVLKGGREIAARFVLRDSDLDLAFLLPEETGLKLPHLELGMHTAPVPETLDELIYLFPLAKALGREVGISVSRARAVVTKPRTFVASDWFVGIQSLGCPVFDASGRVVGLSVLRRAPWRRSSRSGGFRDMFDTVTPVVLTVPDVRDVADQALKRLTEGD